MRSLSALALCLLALPVTAVAQNDECTGALAVANGANGPFSNVGSTTSLPAWPCGAGGNDIWFVYTATCTGTATFDTCGSAFDTVIQAFDSTSCGNSCAANFPGGGPCNDDSCGLQSSVTMSVRTGGAYYIRVGGFASSTGGFSLNIACTPGGGPPDDECGGATPIVVGANGPFTNVGYTTSSPTWPCGAGGNDRWFRYTPATSAPHTFDTCGGSTNYDTTIEVFTGSCPCGLVSLGCNDDSCGLQSSVTASLCQGVLYLIRVGGFASSTGTFSLNLSVGTGTGSFTTLPHQCNGGAHTGITITATGNPNIGGSVTVTLANFAPGAPVIGYGFQVPPYPIAYFCCTIGHNFLVVIFAASNTLNIPCAPSLIGASVFTQGLSFPQPSGCAPPFNLSNTIQITIG